MPEGEVTGLWAGADEMTLYGVGRGAALKVQMLAPGLKDRAATGFVPGHAKEGCAQV